MLLLVSLLLCVTAGAANDPTNLNQLLEKVRGERAAIDARNNAREAEFLGARNQQRALLQKAQSDLAAENRRSVELKGQFDGNEIAIRDLDETLTIRLGNLGELKGVVKQVVGDFKGVVDNSLVTAQFPDADCHSQPLAATDGMPKIEDLDALRIVMLEDMVASGNVSSFPTTVKRADGTDMSTDVVRIGVFNAVVEDRFLRLSEAGTLQELPTQPQGRYRKLAGDLYHAQGGLQRDCRGSEPRRNPRRADSVALADRANRAGRRDRLRDHRARHYRPADSPGAPDLAGRGRQQDQVAAQKQHAQVQ